MRRTLRDLIPTLEIDWLLPAWLLTAILAAFVAETATIGLAVGRLYGLWSGWAIGGVVASTQAIGSMMWSRATQHNANRYVRRHWRGPKDKRKFVEDVRRSEPSLNVRGPATVSVIAGVVSAWLAGALYGADGALTALDVALATAAPAGSVSAALLNGVFAYGETAVATWQAESARPQKRAVASGRESARPQDRPQKRPVRSGRTVAVGHSATLLDTSDTSPALAGHLAELRERLAGQRQSGARQNGTFRRAEIESLLNVSSTHAKTIVRYGLDHGVLEETRRYRYQFREMNRAPGD